MGTGVGTVALVEQADHSVTNTSELAQLTGLRVFGSISWLATAEDKAWEKRKRRLIWAAAGGFLIIGLVIIHFFIMDLWVLTAKILRVTRKYT